MTVHSTQSSGATRPIAPASPRPVAPEVEQKESASRGTDTLSFSGARSAPTSSLSEMVAKAKAAQGGKASFDVADASERLIASHGGNLESAYFESLDLRNTTRDPGYAEKLAAYSETLGMTRNLTPDELRDVEHYMFAAASVAEKSSPAQGAGSLERSMAVLRREPYALGLAVLTAGYSAAKAVNRALPDELKFLKSRTAPSLEEVSAGMKGIWRGMKDGL